MNRLKALLLLVCVFIGGQSGAQPKLHLAPAPALPKKLWKLEDIGHVVGTSADGQMLYGIVASKQRTDLVVWDVRLGKRVRAHVLPVNDLKPGQEVLKALSKDSRYFACEKGATVGRPNGDTLMAIDLQTGKERVWDMAKYANAWGGLQIDTAGQVTRSSAPPRKLTLDFMTGTIIDREPEIKAINAKFVHRGIYDHRFATPDGKYEGYWGVMEDHGAVRVAERKTNKEVLTITGFWGTYPILSPDGKTLVFGASKEKGAPGRVDGNRVICEAPGHIEIWSLTDLQRKAAIPWKQVDCVHNGFDLEFSPDGRHLAVWYGKVSEERMDKTVQFWDVAGKHLKTIELTSKVRKAMYAPGGKAVLVFGRNDLHVLDADTLRPPWKLDGQAAHLPLFFTSDSKQVILVKAYALEWRDLATGKVIRTVHANSFQPEIRRIGTSRFLAFGDFQRADGKPFEPQEREIEDRVKLIHFSRVIHLDSGREVLRAEESGFVSTFHAPADGKTLLQVTVRDNLVRDLTYWQLDAPPKDGTP